MHGEEIVALLVLISFFALVFGIFYIRNRENMALIERGINPRIQQKVLPRPFGNLKYGLLILGAGLGLLAAFLIDINVVHPTHTFDGRVYEDDYPQIYFALVAIGGGLGLVISYLVERKYYDRVDDKP